MMYARRFWYCQNNIQQSSLKVPLAWARLSEPSNPFCISSFALASPTNSSEEHCTIHLCILSAIFCFFFTKPSKLSAIVALLHEEVDLISMALDFVVSPSSSRLTTDRQTAISHGMVNESQLRLLF